MRHPEPASKGSRDVWIWIAADSDLQSAGSEAELVSATENYGRQLDDQWQSERGLTAWLKERIYTGNLGDDGGFHFDDVVPGEYEVDVRQRTMRSLVPGDPPRPFPTGQRLRGTLRVPSVDEASGENGVDLGMVELEKH